VAESGSGDDMLRPDDASEAMAGKSGGTSGGGSGTESSTKSSTESGGEAGAIELGVRSDPSRREVQQAFRNARGHPRLRHWIIGVASVLVVLLVLGVGAVVKLNGNITKVNVSKLLGKRPTNGAAANSVTHLRPLNILVMGSDTRVLGGGTTKKFGKTPGGGSDTTLLVHLAGDRQSAVVISIPRDSMVRAPRNCKDPNSSVSTGPIGMWNANYNRGGPACVIRTFEGNTNVPVDHFMVVNFLGFEAMVDALGSVEVCLPQAVNDPDSKLNLPAGRSRVRGDQALAFVRARKNIGVDGSDLGRINRQQAFLSSMVQEATSKNLLLRPDKLFRFLDAATKSLTADPGMDLNAMRDVAQSVRGLKASQIKFVTVPIENYAPDPNRVQWSPAAKVLWQAIRRDAPLPGTKPKPRPVPSGSATHTGPALTIRPDKITVKISNTSGVTGRARQAAEDLRIQGFHIVSTGNGTDPRSGVTVSYSSPFFEEARTVAAAFPGATLVADETAGNVINVSLGAGSPYVVQVPNRIGTAPLPTRTAAGPTPKVTIKARSADSNICKP
jgi:LCP family protein required for cell wall assembly